ncbi:hypothetical protein M1N47_00210 [Dehalococcoidia bacterium]|nr:hypothetical protein [Dehalococcoidia bacterium]
MANLAGIANDGESCAKIGIDEHEVRRLYLEEKLSINQIANTLGVPRYADKIKGILAAQGIEILCWCGLPRRGHPRCDGCGILVGPKHITKTVQQYKGKGYCDSCFERRVRGAPPEGWDRFLGMTEDDDDEEEEYIELANLGMEDYARRLWGIEQEEHEKW